MAGSHFLERGVHLCTIRFKIGAPGVEPASGRRVDGAGDFSLQNDLLSRDGRIRDGNRRKQGQGVRVPGFLIEDSCRCHLDDPSQASLPFEFQS